MSALAFSRDGRRPVTGDYRDGSVRVLNLESPDPAAAPVALAGRTLDAAEMSEFLPASPAAAAAAGKTGKRAGRRGAGDFC